MTVQLVISVVWCVRRAAAEATAVDRLATVVTSDWWPLAVAPTGTPLILVLMEDQARMRLAWCKVEMTLMRPYHGHMSCVYGLHRHRESHLVQQLACSRQSLPSVSKKWRILDFLKGFWSLESKRPVWISGINMCAYLTRYARAIIPFSIHWPGSNYFPLLLPSCDEVWEKYLGLCFAIAFNWNTKIWIKCTGLRSRNRDWTG